MMVDMMVEHLMQAAPASDEHTLREQVTDFVLELNGQPTIFQMQRFADELRRVGGTPSAPEVYHREYLFRLGERVEERKTAIRRNVATPDDFMVPGARDFLQGLVDRGVELILASGTELESVREEAVVLEIEHFFEDRIYGPGSDPRSFTKLGVMQQALQRTGLPAESLVGIGDGVVETENVHHLGGLAIGVASDEIARSGQVVGWKRSRLIDAGAHLIIPDYQDQSALLAWLWEVE